MKIEHLTFALLATIAIPLLTLSVQEVSAHGNFEVVFNANANQTLRVVIGETGEPAYVDGIHDVEVKITDKLTGLPNTVAVKDNAGTTNILSLDTYFYPESALVSGSAPAIIDADGAGEGVCNTATSSGVQSAAAGGISGCGPAPGYTDSETGGGKVKSVYGSVGMYTGPTKQYYTQFGRTLYHFYGQLNYFQTTPESLVPIDVWYDGKNVKVAYINSAAGTINSGFGLNDVTQIYWPGPGGSSAGTSGVTNATHPDNIRSAIGTDRQNGIDTWNFLADIATALNGITNDMIDIIIPADKTIPGV